MKIICAIVISRLLCLSPQKASAIPEGKASIDVIEEDGRCVTWKEHDRYQIGESLRFRCREGTITEILISYDDGMTYRDETGRFPADPAGRTEIVIKREQFENELLKREHPGREQISFKFMTEEKNGCHESRDYRIFI